MGRLRFLVPLVVVIGCNRGTALTVGGTCELAQSSDACLRCQARECAAPLDGCYGARFRLGHALPACEEGDGPVSIVAYFSNDPRYEAAQCEGPGTTRRCKWNEATGAYDRDCTGPEDCAGFTRCVAECGCGGDCARVRCAGSMTAACSSCVGAFLSDCTARFCATECSR